MKIILVHPQDSHGVRDPTAARSDSRVEMPDFAPYTLTP